MFAEYDHVLSLEEQRKLAEGATEEVSIETNGAYGLKSENQLQTKQVTTEVILAYGLSSEHVLQENPAEQVTESVDHFNSDRQQSPLPDHDSEGYSDYRGLRPVNATGYANVLHRRSSYETSV